MTEKKKEKSFFQKLFTFNTFRLSLIISILVFVIFLFKEEKGWSFGLFDLVELKALDLKFIDRGEIPTNDQVAIAAIDEKSIEAYGRWPWNRIYIAMLIKKLAEMGAGVIAFDVVFSDEDQSNMSNVLLAVAEQVDAIEPEGCEAGCETMREAVLQFLKTEIEQNNPDKILAQIIEAAGNVVLGFFIFTDALEVETLNQEKLAKGIESVEPSKISLIKPWDPDEAKHYQMILRKGVALRAPLPILSNATEAFGHFSFHQDTDGALRWGDLIEEVDNPDEEEEMRLIYPSLSLKAAALHLDKEIVLHTYPKGIDKVSLGLGSKAHSIPTDPQGRMLINYHGGEKTFPHYSIRDILENKVDPRAIKDKIILIGATAIGIYDLRVTPFQEDFPGVEIHANIIDNILNHNYISRPDWAFYFEMLSILIFGVLFGLVLSRVPAIYGAMFMVVVMGSYYLLDKHFFFANGYWVRTVLPMSQAMIIFFSCYVYRYVTEEREKRLTRAAFQQYLNKQVIDAIMNDYDRLTLGGEKREISVLFSDIRGFTSVSETLQPDELGNILTEYLNPMTQIVFDNKGVLDKYMGDAIMAFWGAPQPSDEHAVSACRTALKMMEELEKLNERWREKGIPPFRIGIGINTGQMWVGNMGSAVRFDYTIIGDAVNLGSRLEGTNKQYGSEVLISEFTHEKVKERFLTRELDSIRVKGKEEPVTIYELMSEIDKATVAMHRLKSRFEEALALYRQKRFDKAKAIFVELAETANDKPSAVFASRSEQFLTNPPPEDWDGVFVMTTK